MENALTCLLCLDPVELRTGLLRRSCDDLVAQNSPPQGPSQSTDSHRKDSLGSSQHFMQPPIFGPILGTSGPILDISGRLYGYGFNMLLVVSRGNCVTLKIFQPYAHVIQRGSCCAFCNFSTQRSVFIM